MLKSSGGPVLSAPRLSCSYDTAKYARTAKFITLNRHLKQHYFSLNQCRSISPLYKKYKFQNKSLLILLSSPGITNVSTITTSPSLGSDVNWNLGWKLLCSFFSMRLTGSFCSFNENSSSVSCSKMRRQPGNIEKMWHVNLVKTLMFARMQMKVFHLLIIFHFQIW